MHSFMCRQNIPVVGKNQNNDRNLSILIMLNSRQTCFTTSSNESTFTIRVYVYNILKDSTPRSYNVMSYDMWVWPDKYGYIVLIY